MIIYLGAAVVLLVAAALIWSAVTIVRQQSGSRTRTSVILAVVIIALAFALPRACRGFMAGFTAGQEYRRSHSK